MRLKSVKYILFIILLCTSEAGFTLHAQEWTLSSEEDNIKVLTRLTDKSAIKEVRVTSTLQAPSLNHITNALGDFSLYAQWVPNCVEAKMIEKLSKDELIYYNRTKFPWPLKDRDFLVYRKVWQDPFDYSFNAKTVSHADKNKPIKDAVRVTVFESTWKIIPKGKGYFETTLTLLCDPAGNVPQWFTNELVSVGPIRTFKKLETVINDKKYNFGKTKTYKELPETSRPSKLSSI